MLMIMDSYSVLVSYIIIVLSAKSNSTPTLTPNLGELCPGQYVVLTCSTTGVIMSWRYDGMGIGAGLTNTDPINTPRDVTIESQFIFSVELTSQMPEFASTLSFTADAAMNGHNVSCRVAIPLSGGGFNDMETTQILQITQTALPSLPTDVRINSIMKNSESASVTIEWNPPSQGGSQLDYAITTTPDPISGPPPVTTSTSTIITIDYNTNYTITISASNCLGNGIPSNEHILRIVNCFDPSPVAGVFFSPFSDTTEGASISFNCELGLEPQREDVSVCASNGSWVPDPEDKICLINCNQPVVSANVSVVSTTGTTEGDTVILQCEDGFFPVESVMISCNSAGVWSPDPAELVCREMPGTIGTHETPGTSEMPATNETPANTREQKSTEVNILTIIVPVVIVLLIVISIIITIVIIVVVVTKRNKDHNSHKIKHFNGDTTTKGDSMMPLQEYDTTVHDNGRNDVAEMYSTVDSTKPRRNVTNSDDQYSHIQREPKNPKPYAPPHQAASDEYSHIQRGPKKPQPYKSHEGRGPPPTSSPSGPPPPNPGGLVYADVGIHHKKPAPVPTKPKKTESEVVYSGITGTLPTLTSPDANLDLNMMIIQVRPITSEWFNFGAAIGIPHEILVELNNMKLADYDKLVEMLDYWFKSFPKGTSPTWRDVAKGLNIIGKSRMASELMKVYDSGDLPVIVDNSIPVGIIKAVTPPPPLPPKIDGDDDMPPPPPIPKKTEEIPAVPARPIKAPPRPPKQ